MGESDPQSVQDSLLKDYRGAVEYAKDILQLLSSDDLLKRTADRVAVLKDIKSEIGESSCCLANTTKTLEAKHQAIEEAICFQYRDLMGDENAQPHQKNVKDEVHKLTKQIRKKEKYIQQLENEKKILDFNRKCRNMQKKIVDVNFDLASSKDKVKGYIRKPGGELHTFEFDLNEESMCDIADYMWDQVS